MSETSLQSITRITQEIEAFLTAGEWRKASELEEERRAALEELLDAVSDPREKAKLCEDAQRITRALIGQIDHHQRRLVQDAYIVRQSRAAAKAYSAFTSPDLKR